MLVTIIVVMAAVVVVDVMVPVGSTGTHQDHKELAPTYKCKHIYIYIVRFLDSHRLEPLSLNIKTH